MSQEQEENFILFTQEDYSDNVLVIISSSTSSSQQQQESLPSLTEEEKNQQLNERIKNVLGINSNNNQLNNNNKINEDNNVNSSKINNDKKRKKENKDYKKNNNNNNQNPTKKKKNNNFTKTFAKGNYNNYYSYRYNEPKRISSNNSDNHNNNNHDSNSIITNNKDKKITFDIRIDLIEKVLNNNFFNDYCNYLIKQQDQQKEIVDNKLIYNWNVLDIGCNQGLFTLQLSNLLFNLQNKIKENKINTHLTEFNYSLLGLEIDDGLLRRAKSHVRKLKEINSQSLLLTSTENNSTHNNNNSSDRTCSLGMDLKTYISMERLEDEEEKTQVKFQSDMNRKILLNYKKKDELNDINNNSNDEKKEEKEKIREQLEMGRINLLNILSRINFVTNNMVKELIDYKNKKKDEELSIEEMNQLLKEISQTNDNNINVNNNEDDIKQKEESNIKVDNLLNTCSLTLQNMFTVKYDFIFCLSVTKWIHLNDGDDAIKYLFHKMYYLLKDSTTVNNNNNDNNNNSDNNNINGGILILEPQPWKSYLKKRNLTKSIQYHFERIKFRPKDFKDYLLNQVGFKKCDTYYVDELLDLNNEQNVKQVMNDKQSKKKGFKKRPICFYYK
ncbi:hypothetical protein ABK040_009495 [Willaertia magna]